MLVAVDAAAILALLSSPYGSPADRVAPLTLTACGALLLLVVMELRRPTLRAAPLAAVAGLLLLVAVIAPPRTSHDLWSYAMYGRIVAVHHADPYRLPPRAFPRDPALQRVEPGWRSARSVYGPVFTGLSAALARITGGSALATRLAYQLFAATSVGIVLLVLVRRGRAVAVAAIGLHPLVVVQLVNGGHNDAVVGLLLMLAVLACRRPRPVVVGLVAAVAVSTKLVAALPVVALLAWLWRKHGRRSAIVAGTTVGALVGAGYLMVGGPSALRPLASAAGYVSRATIWRFPLLGAHQGLSRTALMVALVAGPALVVAAVRMDKGASAAAASSVLMYLLAAPYVLPWYFWWAIPVAVLADDALTAGILFVATLMVDIAYTWRSVPRPDALDHALRAEIFATPIVAGVAITILVTTALATLAPPRTPRRRGSGSGTPRWPGWPRETGRSSPPFRGRAPRPTSAGTGSPQSTHPADG